MTHPHITQLEGTGLNVLVEPYEWRPGCWIPRGFQFDGASVPTLLGLSWRITYPPNHPKVRRASLVHDWLYRSHGTSRKDADQLFYSLLIEDGVPRWKASVMYWALRLGGHAAW